MIGALLLNWVLCRYYHKRWLKLKTLPINGYLPFFHNFEQSSLRFCRSAVYFIYQYDIAENRAGLELKTALPRIKNGSADHIAWHQVGSELNARKTYGDSSAQQLCR